MKNEIYLGDIENSIECHLQRLSATEKKVIHWLANQPEAVEKFPKTANLDLSTSEFWAAIQSLMRRCLLDKLPSETSAYFQVNSVFKSGSSLPFMLNQQTRCQDNILLTQKFRKFLKP